MSTVWQGDTVLLREPWNSVSARIARRAVFAIVFLVLSGVPGTPWTGLVSPLALRVPLALLGALSLLLWVLAIVNVWMNQRVLLVVRGTGAIERPRSVQERWLRRPQEYAIGKKIAVAEHFLVGHQRASDPRITLTGEGTVPRVPLFRTAPADFVAEANAALKGRGIILVLEEERTN